MKVMHLPEKQARDIVAGYAQAFQGKAHESEVLWALIKEVRSSFPGLTWREDKKCFYRGL